MRINSEEAMIKAIKTKRAEKVDWLELSRRSRAAKAQDDHADSDDAEPKTASRLAGA